MGCHTLYKCILWFDNFYRRVFQSEPGKSNCSLNCTTVAVLRMPRALDVMPGFPSVQELHRCTRTRMSDMLMCNHKCFVDSFSDLI